MFISLYKLIKILSIFIFLSLEIPGIKMHRPKFFSVFSDALLIIAIVNARKVCIANEALGNVRSVGFSRCCF